MNPVDAALTDVHQVEWRRGAASGLDEAMRHPSPEVRLAAAVALGRLKQGEGVPALRELLGDPVPSVRLAAIEALGWVPGGAAPLRVRLATDTDSGAPWRDAERTAAIAALGRAGDASDVPRLIGLLGEPFPDGATAAAALGRLGRRGVPAAEQATESLIACTGRFDLRVVEPCAWALSRLGIRDPALAARAADRWGEVASEQARAWLIKAAWPGLEPERRTTLFVEAFRGTSRLVQVAALDAVDEDQVPADIVAPWIVHSDSWVRAAALGALGRLDTPDADLAIGRVATDGDLWTATSAVEAAGASAPGDARDETLPAPLRAAATSGLSDVDLLIALARTDAEPAVRSAAAGALSERDDAGPRLGVQLLDSEDVAVREVAADLVKGGDPVVGAAVLAAAERESDPEVFQALLLRLDELAAREPRVWPSTRLRPVLARASGFWSPRVAAAAAKLAKRLSIEAPVPASVPERRAVGDREIAGPWPVLDEVRRIRGARVRTERGEFVLSLDPETAPVAVWNFAQLADAGWFDGRLVHRLVPGFVMQTGCPRGDGWGGPGWTLPDEVSTVPFSAGSLGMARAEPDTGGSQWFVSLTDTPHLTGEYTRFGEVAHGLSVVRRLRRGDTIVEVQIERVP